MTFRDCGAAVFQGCLALAVGDVTNRPHHCGKMLAKRRFMIARGNDTAKVVSIESRQKR